MDSFTHIVLGAATGEAVLGSKVGKKAWLWGAVAGTIPDLDVFFAPFLDDLHRITIHRGISHSLLFAVLLPMLLAYLFSRWKNTRQGTFRQWYLLFFLGIFSHILLDTFTSYGTQVFLPFSNVRLSFHSIAILDPVFTLPLVVGLVLCWGYAKNETIRRSANYGGMLLSSLYLIFTLVHKTKVNHTFRQALEAQHIAYDDFVSIPNSMANLLWHGVARNSEGLYMAEYSVFDRKELPQFTFFPDNDSLLIQLGQPEIYQLIQWFSDGFYAVRKEGEVIRAYTLKCDLTGLGELYQRPATSYIEIVPDGKGGYHLRMGMLHPELSAWERFQYKWNRMMGRAGSSTAIPAHTSLP